MTQYHGHEEVNLPLISRGDIYRYLAHGDENHIASVDSGGYHWFVSLPKNEILSPP